MIKNQITFLLFSIWIIAATDTSKTYDDGYCPICYDENISRFKFPCGHVLCHNCLLKNYFEQEKHNCHTCRSNITTRALLFNILKQGNLIFIKQLLMLFPEHLIQFIEICADEKSTFDIRLVSKFLLEIYLQNTIELEKAIDENGSIETIKQFLDAGANPNHNCFGLVSTLDKILAKKRFDVGNLLIQYGCNPNKKDQEGITPLYRYLREKGKNGEQCDLETLEFLLNHVDPEICVRKKIEEQHFSQDYPIYCVSDPKAAELMLKYGAKIDDKFSSLGDCLLMEMCKIANFSMIEFYVNAGLDINRKNNMDNTPLGIAFSSFGDTQEVRKIAKFLLEKGANPNVCYASQRALNSISFLLTGRKPKDDTLLQYVIKQNDSKMVKHLLFYGANPYLKNSDDKDTFDLLDDFEMCSDLKGGKDYRKEKFLKHLGRYQLNTLKRKRNARQLKLKEMYQLNALNLGDKI